MILSRRAKLGYCAYAVVFLFLGILFATFLWDIVQIAHSPHLIETLCETISEKNMTVLCRGSSANLEVTFVQTFIIAPHATGNQTYSICAWEMDCQRVYYQSCFLSTHSFLQKTCWIDVNLQRAYSVPFYITKDNIERICEFVVGEIVLLIFTFYVITMLQKFHKRVRQVANAERNARETQFYTALTQ